jgi:hypothetical protein
LSDDHSLSISVVAATVSEVEVEYYRTVGRTIIITNNSERRQLIEDVTLRFASDSAQIALNVLKACGWELAPSEVREQRVEITPMPLYLEGTNQFDVKVCFRTLEQGRVSGPEHEVCSSPSYIIVREPKERLGQVFISLKQPEDLDLGRLLARMVRRAGITPFLKDAHRRPGEDIWKATLEPALRASQIAAVIWTENTTWDAEGVKREIKFCRDNGIPEVLLLAGHSAVPNPYTGTDIEYSRFDVDNPGKAFADAADTLRQRFLRAA